MQTIKNLPFNHVVGTGVASLELTPGMSYNRVLLKQGGTDYTPSHITRIVGKLNGKIFYDISGERLAKINAYRDLNTAAGYLMVDFSDPVAKRVGGELLGTIGTASGVSSFTLEIHNDGATSPTLESWSLVSDPRPLEASPIFALVHHPVTLAAGGKFPITLPHGPESGHLIKRVHFFNSNMTHLEVKKNGLVIFEEVDTATNSFIQGDYGLVPQAGVFTYDPVVNRDMQANVPLANARTMQFNVTLSAADTVDVYVEYLAKLSNL